MSHRNRKPKPKPEAKSGAGAGTKISTAVRSVKLDDAEAAADAAKAAETATASAAAAASGAAAKPAAAGGAHKHSAACAHDHEHEHEHEHEHGDGDEDEDEDGEGDDGEGDGDDDGGEGDDDGEGDEDEDGDGDEGDAGDNENQKPNIETMVLSDLLRSFSSNEPFLRTPGEEKVEAAGAFDGKVVAVYFGRQPNSDAPAPAGSTAPDYLPLLTKVAAEIKQKLESKANALPAFEIVCVSCDELKSDYKRTVKSLPNGTLVLPFRDVRAGIAIQHLLIDNPPALALFGADGRVITLDGYELLEEQGSASYPWLAPPRTAVPPTGGDAVPVARPLSMIVANEWQSKPCLVLIANGAVEAKQSERLIADLNATARKHPKLGVFYAFDNRVSAITVRDTLSVQTNPLLCILNLKDDSFRTKFVWSPPAPSAMVGNPGPPSSLVGAAEFEKFASDYENNKLAPALKSAPRPAHDRDPDDPKSTLQVVVASSFQELVVNEKRAVMLLSSAPWNLDCRQLEAHLETVNRVLHALLQPAATATAAAAATAATTAAARDLSYNKLPALVLSKINCRDNELDSTFLPEEDELLVKLFLPSVAGGAKRGIVYREPSFTAGAILAFLHKHLTAPATDSKSAAATASGEAFDLKAAKQRLESIRSEQFARARPALVRAYQVTMECRQTLHLRVCQHIFEQFGLGSGEVSAYRKKYLKSLKVKNADTPLSCDQWLALWADFCNGEDIDASHLVTMTNVCAVLPCVTEMGFCSYSLTAQNHTAQEFWLCDTCGVDGGLGCCSACKKKCHKGHKLRRSPHGDTDSYCDCGAGSFKAKCKALKSFDCDKAAAANSGAAAAPIAAASAAAASAVTGLSDATKALGNLSL